MSELNQEVENNEHQFPEGTSSEEKFFGVKTKIGKKESEKVSDSDAEKMSFDISRKIESEMTYPGQVKVTVIRETRAVNFAK